MQVSTIVERIQRGRVRFANRTDAWKESLSCSEFSVDIELNFVCLNEFRSVLFRLVNACASF